ncbi:MAG TPA: glycine C-acetyltransferase [Rhodospirillales bacterium]|jgi:glycine C-acetyltransferase|nr:glycine C-acetyltransferase [Rhodospirillales bacterium]
MLNKLIDHLNKSIDELKNSGLYKEERIITSQQSREIDVLGSGKVLNLCSNNYLGLADNAELAKTAKFAIDRYGYGMASVRFICGTQEEHKLLENKISSFLGMGDSILYSSCFDANTGLFETLLDDNDAIISDELNHASIIDGVRLSKAKRVRYANNNMEDLEQKLQECSNSRFKLIVTDGVFSMDGIIANLSGICTLAEKYDSLVMVDDSHAIGFLGKHGRGTPEYCDVSEKVHIITGTLGKALGGASGGYVASSPRVIEWLRQRSRPYLFSNTLAPVIAATSIKAFELVERGDDLRKKLSRNADKFRRLMMQAGFKLIPGEHPIIPIMLGDAKLAQKMATNLLKQGIYVTGFSFPVVPKGKARIRTQMSAAHSEDDIDTAVDKFVNVGRELGVI